MHYLSVQTLLIASSHLDLDSNARDKASCVPAAFRIKCTSCSVQLCLGMPSFWTLPFQVQVHLPAVPEAERIPEADEDLLHGASREAPGRCVALEVEVAEAVAGAAGVVEDVLEGLAGKLRVGAVVDTFAEPAVRGEEAARDAKLTIVVSAAPLESDVRTRCHSLSLLFV